jgi:hypothetical protein
MKKLFIILFMLVYGVTSSGMTITLHYCCGKVDDISFSGKQERSCPMGGKHMKNNSCCKDQQVTAKIAADQQAAAKWLQVNQDNQGGITSGYFLPYYNSSIVTISRLARGTPIPISPVPIFIRNCVFRI